MATGKSQKGLTVRGKAMRRCTEKRGITEDPAGSNTDKREDGIRAWQRRLGAWLIGLAWCGTSVADKAHAGGAKTNYRWASCVLIEEDARRGVNGFRDLLMPTLANLRRCLRADLALMFGRGIHVAMIRAFKYVRGVGWVVITEEGNTTPPAGSGNQANGGWQGRRERPLSDVYRFARIDYPGGRARRVGGTLALLARSAALSVHGIIVGGSDELVKPGHAPAAYGSDSEMLEELEKMLKVGALDYRGTAAHNLARDMRAAGVTTAPF